MVSAGANVNKAKNQGKVRIGRQKVTKVTEPRDKMRKAFPYSIS